MWGIIAAQFARTKSHYDALHAEMRARRARVLQRAAAQDHELVVKLLGEDLAELKLTAAVMIRTLLDAAVIDAQELLEHSLPPGETTGERSRDMSCGAGWMDNYVKGRSRLYESVLRRREKLGRRGEEPVIGKSDLEQILDDIAELKLVVATALHVLVNQGVLSERALLAEAEAVDALDGSADGKLHGRVEPDGTVRPERKERTDLDDLADALEGP